MKKTFLITIVMLIGSIANALDLTNNFNFEGVLVDNSDVPITTTVSLKFQIYDPSVTCLIFEETHASITPDSSGYFSLKIGTGTRNTGADGGGIWRNLFQNDSQVRAPGANCGSGYNPATGDGRKLRVTVGATVLSPDFAMSAVPMATVAESLQGKLPTDFIIAGNAATGDLSGINSAPTVSKIQGRTVSATAPTANQVLTWTGSQWDPMNPPAPTGPAAGDLTGTYPNPVVSKIQGAQVSAAAPGVGQVLVWNGSAWTPSTPPAATPTGAAGGDLTGSYPNPLVASIQGRGVSSAAPAFNDILQWNGSQWVPASLNDSSKLPISGGTMTGQISMSTYKITNLGAPSVGTDAASKTYVDAIASTSVMKSGDSMSGALMMTINGNPTNAALQFLNPGNGIFSPTPGELGFTTNTVEAMRIDGGGNVGIGTNTPSAMLDVNGPVKIGPSGTAILNHKYYNNQTCTIGSLPTGNAGNCVMTLSGSGVSVSGAQNVICSHYGNPAYPNIIHSCYVSGFEQVTLVVVNYAGSTQSPPGGWNVTVIKY